MPEQNLASWSLMVACSIEAGQLDLARKLYWSMPEQDLVLVTTLITPFSQHGQLEEAKFLFDRLPEKDLVAWNSILAACVCHGLVDEARELFDGMPERDAFSWTSILAAFFQAGDLVTARRMSEAMLDRNSVSWTAMLAAYAQNGLYTEAFDFHLMKIAHSLDQVCFVSILVASSHAGKVYDTRQWFLSMIIDYEMEPHKQHYSCMVDILGPSGGSDRTHCGDAVCAGCGRVEELAGSL